jgi:secreted PhoX family phosphatase
VLIAEENFHQYFAGDPEKTPEARNLERYGFKPVSERRRPADLDAGDLGAGTADRRERLRPAEPTC